MLLVNIWPIGKIQNLRLRLYFLVKLIVVSKTTFTQTKYSFFENLGIIEHNDARKISYEDALIFEQIHLALKLNTKSHY
jgi:hypothetical protein